MAQDTQNEIEGTNGASVLTDGLGVSPLSMATLENALREIDLLPKLDQWVLISPTGQMYKGTVEQILPVIFKNHPANFMNKPFGINQIKVTP